jgi:hypothetical protein
MADLLNLNAQLYCAKSFCVLVIPHAEANKARLKIETKSTTKTEIKEMTMKTLKIALLSAALLSSGAAYATLVPEGNGHFDIASYAAPEGNGHIDVASYAAPEGNGHFDIAAYAAPEGNGHFDV